MSGSRSRQFGERKGQAVIFEGHHLSEIRQGYDRQPAVVVAPAGR